MISTRKGVIKHDPVIGHQYLDLYELFLKVNNFGGYARVVRDVGSWSKIW